MKKIWLILFLFLWIVRFCYSTQDVTRLLETLSDNQAQTAKVVYIGNGYNVFYEL